jgi:hypothetical protein
MIVTLFIPLAIARYSFAANLTPQNICCLLSESQFPTCIPAASLTSDARN